MHPSRTGRWAAICAVAAAALTSTTGRRPSAAAFTDAAALAAPSPLPVPVPVPVLVPDLRIRKGTGTGTGTGTGRSEAPPSPDVPAGRRQILVPDHSPIELYPPLGASPVAPLTVMLHGMCMGPVDVCDYWSDDGRAGSWLACPAGNVRCGDAFDWGGPTADRVAAVGAQLEAVGQAYGALLDHARGDVLVGYSRGGYLARDLVYARPGLFRGVVFLGAAVAKPDARRFRDAGVTRVVLAAGEYDGARPSMLRSVGTLEAGGVKARYVSLGRMGHGLPGDVGRVLREAIAWIREGD